MMDAREHKSALLLNLKYHQAVGSSYFATNSHYSFKTQKLLNSSKSLNDETQLYFIWSIAASVAVASDIDSDTYLFWVEHR